MWRNQNERITQIFHRQGPQVQPDDGAADAEIRLLQDVQEATQAWSASIQTTQAVLDQVSTLVRRVLCWFSCGAASAVATKMSLKKYVDDEVIPICCDTRPSEDPDNYRFSQECEAWFGVPITYIQNAEYRTVDEVFEHTKYMSGIGGARCTTELKKIPRLRFAQAEDFNVFGFTADEKERADDFESRNPDMRLLWPLIDVGMTKEDCYNEIGLAGIKLPQMYQLGFDHNNCPGCVKASSPWYWQMVRKHYPETFKRRCEQSRKIGCRLVRVNGNRIFLDELPDQDYPSQGKENISCGPECGFQMKLL